MCQLPVAQTEWCCNLHGQSGTYSMSQHSKRSGGCSRKRVSNVDHRGVPGEQVQGRREVMKRIWTWKPVRRGQEGVLPSQEARSGAGLLFCHCQTADATQAANP